ncbi:hypothetical protein ASG89_21530 [Paenibacillus sp. Soil766]|uniref:ATP-binding protein n=1 Tax=Paenibacillus sp. Soil766 TaxID=1736404 RepID=UPI0007152CEC|nr:ATP-binding protein [Paenibacillus sp. Soil766]KRF04876.1 hypothetical protein ASG89_21530 [Paenibacillus sp. Soil766]
MSRRSPKRFTGVILFLLLIILCSVGATYFVNDGFSRLQVLPPKVLPSMSKWEAHLGKLPIVDNQLQDTESDWKPYLQIASTAQGQTNMAEFWVRVRLPSGVAALRDAQLNIQDIKAFEVFVDHRKIASINADLQETKTKSIFIWKQVPLPDDATGKWLQIRIIPQGSSVMGVYLPMRIVEAQDNLIELIRIDTIKWALIACFLFLSVVSLGVFIMHRDVLYAYFSVLNFTCAFACLALTYTLQIYGDWSHITYYYSVCIPVGMVAVVGIFERLTDASLHNRFRISRYLLKLFALTCIIIAYLHEPWVSRFIHIYLVVLAIIIPLLAIPVMRIFYKQRDGEAAWLVMGIGAITLGLCLNYATYFFPRFGKFAYDYAPYYYIYWIENIGIFGVFIFVLSLGMVFITRLRSVFVQNQVISERLQDQNSRLQELDRLKDDFLANTSHELRTPLQGIIGLTESLLDGVAGALHPKVQTNLELVVSSGKRLSRLIHDLLDLSKLNHQDIALDLVSLPLPDTVSLVLAAFEPQAAAKSIQLVKRFPTGLPLVSADANRLQQILYNLIGNAVKFTDTGEVCVTAKQVGEFVEVSIIDTGIGIPKNKLHTVLAPFEQAELGARRGGTGLGLTISHKLIAMHGGQFHLDAAEGSGTTASFTIPISRKEEDVAASEGSFLLPVLDNQLQWELSAAAAAEGATSEAGNFPASRIRNPLPSATVLLVDDEPVNLQVLDNYLSGSSLRLLKAANGKEALALIEQHVPDLLLLDVLLPDMNGYDICRRLRERYDESTLPIILLTAKGRLVDLLEGFDAGANDYIVKPFTRHELLARVGIQLKLSRFTLELERMVQERTSELEFTTTRLRESVRETAETLNELTLMEERNLLAQEIHDHVGHTLTTSIVQMEAAKMLLERGDPRGNDKLALSQQLVRKGLDDIRESVRTLKQQGADFQLEPALKLLLAQTEDVAGMNVEHDISPLPPLSSMHKKAIYHALKEGLTNGIRHGRCTSFQFKLMTHDDKLIFSLWNDGERYEETALGFGLQSMMERITQLGGSLRISGDEERGNRGCLLIIELPVVGYK